MKTAEVRSAYLSFFKARGHRVIPSSTLVPGNDPTLLFTNSGMVQFKDPLLGREDPGYKRAVSSQRCVRAGGKHNDLENVGYTARHLTFFEMLGNFSFGDYFKEDTIVWAWEFVTQVLKLPPERLWVTVHPTDDESRALWIDHIGMRADRVTDLEENFWTMGDTGPCGPCTEIFYDHGPDVAGGPPGSADENGDRFVEFWNLVFPQFDRSADGVLTPLPQPGVDTGMGLERISAILQGVHSVYEIDLMSNLLRAAGSLAGVNSFEDVLANPSFRVISDHLRSSAFLIADGVMPGNENRDYVLRRIMRRGLRHGYKLNLREPFLYKLVDALVNEMGDAYPLLQEKHALISKTILAEEERFSETLSQGMELLDKTIKSLHSTVIPGEVIFQLYDTYGFPTDMSADIARERGLEVDTQGFDAAMEAQRSRGRAAQKFSASLGQRIHAKGRADFCGYLSETSRAAIVGLFSSEGDSLTSLSEGQEGVMVLDRTPFYAESGGQIGDCGLIWSATARFEVTDTQKSGDQHLHLGRLVDGSLKMADEVTAEVDQRLRQSIRRNHSATHLLHAALRGVLGKHVQQKGSLVSADRLRFDFSHTQPVSKDELAQVELLVNQQIQNNTSVEVDVLDFEAAVKRGAMALFGEKYGDEVRVLTMGQGYSVELCGGTHVTATGDIGLCKITQETGIAAGVRRIEALTGIGALTYVSDLQGVLANLSETLKAPLDSLGERVGALVEDNRRLTRDLTMLNQKLAASQGSDLLGSSVSVDGIDVVAGIVQGERDAMMQTLDVLKSKSDSTVVVLGQIADGKVNLVAGVSKSLTDRIQAQLVLKFVADQVGARGGGRADMAQAGGGSKPDALAAALDGVVGWVAAQGK